MVPNLRDLDLEATTSDKVLFVVVALPLLGALGAVLRVFVGLSEQATLMVVLPLLCVAFVSWHLGVAIRRARRNAGDGEQGNVPPADAPATPYVQQRLHARPE